MTTGSDRSADATRRCIVVYVDENTHEVQRITNGESHYGTVGPSAERFREILEDRCERYDLGPSEQVLVGSFMAACYEEGLNRGDIQNAQATGWVSADEGELKNIIIGEAEPSTISDFVPEEA